MKLLEAYAAYCAYCDAALAFGTFDDYSAEFGIRAVAAEIIQRCRADPFPAGIHRKSIVVFFCKVICVPFLLFGFGDLSGVEKAVSVFVAQLSEELDLVVFQWFYFQPVKSCVEIMFQNINSSASFFGIIVILLVHIEVFRAALQCKQTVCREHNDEHSDKSA